jgi:hypothetical protein
LRLMNEETMFKFIIEKNGAILAVTARRRSYFFFLCVSKVGVGIAPITDPLPGIVEMCGYDVRKIGENWNRLSRAMQVT